MTKARIAIVASVLALVPLLALGWLPGVASAAEPIYSVMNTSEYPPDGIYFRNSPDWNDTNRITGFGIYAGDQVRLKCWQNGTNVPRPDGGSNTVWYLADNVTRPTSPVGGNSGWLNAHFVNDGTGPNEVAPGVIQCGATPPPPPPSPTTSQPAPPAIDRIAETDRLLWNSPMSLFLQAKKIGLYYPQLRYDSDGCSVPPWLPRYGNEPNRSQPDGYDFRGPCWRHDFGYRNYKTQNRFNETIRLQIDNNFKRDMYNVCDQYHGLKAYKGIQCRRIADSYYSAVRQFGS